jgi:hypothetical protein
MTAVELAAEEKSRALEMLHNKIPSRAQVFWGFNRKTLVIRKCKLVWDMLKH